jgi:hypothetical protein
MAKTKYQPIVICRWYHNIGQITDIIKGEGQARKNWLERKGKKKVALF